ncbi:MAG: type II secretion system protein GspE [Gammaproteobacteria bacterium]|nr:MAG: type II secretion system protein GspE [Gammaproteobacteria bacterium]PIE37692.1 MAG: type II secretion system protein GspE [Gammaproteobacteria bacterium]
MNATANEAGTTAEARRDLPYTFAKRHGVLLEHDTEGKPVLVHRPDVALTALSEARRKAGGKKLRREAVSADDFDARLTSHYEGETGQAMDIMDDLGDGMDLAQLAESMPEPEDLLESTDDAPVIRLINAMLTEAVRKQASDIHIEPFEKRLAIRYRVDGVMQKLIDPPRAIAPLVISRLKVMAKLDIAERRLPQDGRISLRIAGRPVDVRVSTLPSGHGERVVLRLLDKQAGRLDLEHLGMPAPALEALQRTLALSHGIILVTGPTGSGKTTTLYAALARLNTSRFTILTVEDPIEYYIDGVGQTQVNNKVHLDFARGLRAILRQDPDIVMVGEIRDVETAEIAVQASLTGHLVLSTLHTNTAVGAVTRLRDMGIEPFLLSSSLVGLVAQRLVRLLCPHCKRPHAPSDAELATLGTMAGTTSEIYAPHGCERCSHTGYVGRQGVYEVVEVNDHMRTMIHEGASEHDIERYARTRSPGINQDSMRLVLAGKTSLEEVLRVTREG